MMRGRGMGMGRGNNFVPVKVGEELDVKIEAVGEKGDGIARVKGFVLFIPGVKEGDQVKVKVTRVLSKVGFAEVVGQGSASSAASDADEESSEDNGPTEDSEDFGEDSGSSDSDDSDSNSEDSNSEDFGDEEEQN